MFQQIIFIVGGLFGLFVLYFIGRLVIAFVSPETDEKIELYFILKDIKHHFGFLFEKGYKIYSAEYAARFNGNWTVQFQSQDCVIFIVQDRSHIEISLAPVFGAEFPDGQIDLERMIFLITQGQVHVGGFEGNLTWGKKRQFERMAGLLNEYLDRISIYLGKNHQNNGELNNAL